MARPKTVSPGDQITAEQHNNLVANFDSILVRVEAVEGREQFTQKLPQRCAFLEKQLQELREGLAALKKAVDKK